MRTKLQPLLFFAPILCLVNLSGCRSNFQPIEKPLLSAPSTITTPPLIQKQSASLYQHTEVRPFADDFHLRLKAIEELLAIGAGNAAKESAESINPATLSTLQQMRLNLLYIQILLNFGEAEQAIEKLTFIQPNLFTQEDKIKYFQSQAFAFSLTGNLLESAKSRIELHLLLPEVERSKNQAAIIETLNLLPESALQYAQTNELAGWMSLAKVSQLIDHTEFTSQLRQWRATFPDHPADTSLLAQLNDISHELTQPKAIAILLPESGTFAQAGSAIRAGFMAAYNHANSTTSLRFYNTSQITSSLSLYDLAVTEGAALVIGPLNKESIKNISESPLLSIPVLALNHIDGLKKENLYQFALSPIDDAEQISNKVRLDGYLKVLALVPDNSTGQRINSYFHENIESFGGSLLESQSYNTKDTDFSLTIKKLLNIDESDLRYQQILKIVPTAKYIPRTRQDAQALLLSARSSEARSINPQLKFYQTNNIPVYAMANVYTGQPNPSQDVDLNGITFCDIPWFFVESYSGEMNIDALKDSWQKFTTEYLKLFAMGIDAFDLTSRINDLKYNSFPGASGLLSLTNENRIKRDLVCASFINGKPEIINQVKHTSFSLSRTNNSSHNNVDYN